MNTETNANLTQTAVEGSSDSQPASWVNKNRKYVIAAALALLISFFLPWVYFLGVGLSGWHIVRTANDLYRYVWIVPAFACVTLLSTFREKNSASIRRLTGFIPFAVLIYALKDAGANLFSALGFGAWLGLLAAGILLLLPAAGMRKD